MSQPNLRDRLAVLALSATLFACGSKGPCYWDGHQDRESGAVVAMALSCDGVSKPPTRFSVQYIPTQQPLGVQIDANSLVAHLAFDASLPDGTYAIEGPAAEGKSAVTASGAKVTGTFTFTRSRDIPFIDIASPELKTYRSRLDATFNLSIVWPHPDPSMGVGCQLETGEQQVALVVSGPVVDCKASFSTGH